MSVSAAFNPGGTGSRLRARFRRLRTVGPGALFVAALLLAGAVPAAAQIAARLLIADVDRPVRLVAPPGDSRLFVVEQTGRIRVFDRQGVDRGVFLDLQGDISIGGERGLLGLAFPPDHASSGRFYVDYTDLAGDSRLVRYTVSADPDRADAASADTLLTIDQPYSNHNGGHLEFGPDGMLYFGLGDGGNGGDPQNRAQDGQSLLGKLLRLDVSGPDYVPAAGNPFLATPPRDEIWALGLRNPWCFAFDRLTGDLYVADVGQSALEEIDATAAGLGGLNYGWRLMEGDDCYNPSVGCNNGSLILPVHQYTHGGSPYRCSISGGYVYRGSAIPSLQGTYFFADYCSNQVWGLRWTASGGVSAVTDWTQALAPPGGFAAISSFGQDAAGELYILDHGAGSIYRLELSTSGAAPPPAVRPWLGQNEPNPFNPETRLTYSMPDGGMVTLSVHDVTGRRVRILAQGPVAAGEHAATWDGRAADARAMPSGVYFARLATASGVTVTKMLLAR